jgi:hypothetical protein
MKTLLERFKELPDYRKYKIAKYNVGEVMYLSLLAMLSGANGYEDMALWIKLKRRELSKLLGHGLIPPAYTTIRNIYLNIDVEALNKMFEEWSHEIARREGLSELNIVSSDGKTMRGSRNKTKDEKARHIVSLFLSKEKITLAQTKVDDKSNEIPALLELLDSLKLENCVITVDALHTQKKLYEK